MYIKRQIERVRQNFAVGDYKCEGVAEFIYLAYVYPTSKRLNFNTGNWPTNQIRQQSLTRLTTTSNIQADSQKKQIKVLWHLNQDYISRSVRNVNPMSGGHTGLLWTKHTANYFWRCERRGNVYLCSQLAKLSNKTSFHSNTAKP